VDRIWNFDFFNHRHLDLLVDGKLFGVMMMNRVNLVRDFNLDDFAGDEKKVFVGKVSS
jgi:hypothetical protein